MCGAVLFFAFASAQDPVRIGITALLISRPRPMHNLLAFWLGLMVTGYGAALAALFLLRDFMVPVMKIVTSVTAPLADPPVQIVLGVLALSIAAKLAVPSGVRRAAPASVPGGDPFAPALPPKAPNVFERLSQRWRARLEGRSL